MKLYKYEHSDHAFPVVPLHPIIGVKCVECGLRNQLHMAMDKQDVVIDGQIKQRLMPVYYCTRCGAKYNVVGDV